MSCETCICSKSKYLIFVNKIFHRSFSTCHTHTVFGNSVSVAGNVCAALFCLWLTHSSQSTQMTLTANDVQKSECFCWHNRLSIFKVTFLHATKKSAPTTAHRGARITKTGNHLSGDDERCRTQHRHDEMMWPCCYYVLCQCCAFFTSKISSSTCYKFYRNSNTTHN